MIVQKLKEFREKRGYSQENLASVANVSRETVHRAERGKSVTFSTATRLAKALGATLTDIGG